jgi:lipoprotein-anchoring transpeptidase ErfK/SrfK
VSRIRSSAIVMIAIAVGALAAGCGSSSDAAQAKASLRAAASTTAPPTARQQAPTVRQQPTPAAQQFPAYTATALQSQIDVHSAPNGPATVTLTSPLPEGTPLTLLLTPGITQAGGGWLQVFLPTKPNGSTGWIPANEVKVQGDPYRLVVTQSTHQLKVYNFSNLERSYPVAVGAPETPTPLGTYYITELLKTTNPGVYGDYAYGLSGHSPTLTDFDGYDAEIGLHGTGDPSSIGHSVSHGCVRLNNADVDVLVPMLPLGTPVEIQA